MSQTVLDVRLPYRVPEFLKRDWSSELLLDIRLDALAACRREVHQCEQINAALEDGAKRERDLEVLRFRHQRPDRPIPAPLADVRIQPPPDLKAMWDALMRRRAALIADRDARWINAEADALQAVLNAAE